MSISQTQSQIQELQARLATKEGNLVFFQGQVEILEASATGLPRKPRGYWKQYRAFQEQISLTNQEINSIKTKIKDAEYREAKHQDFIEGEWCPDFAQLGDEKFTIEDAYSKEDTLETSFITLDFDEFCKYACSYLSISSEEAKASFYSYVEDTDIHIINFKDISSIAGDTVYASLDLINKYLDQVEKHFREWFLEYDYNDYSIDVCGPSYRSYDYSEKLTNPGWNR